MTPAFTTAESQAASTSNTPSANLKYSKKIRVGPRAGSANAAIDALALDLPGQVFISYSPKASMEPINTDGPLFGEITVYANSEDLASSVVPMQKRTMTDTKLTIASNTRNISAAKGEFMLTEIVLLKKAAIRKLISNGAADVVVSNDVLFTRHKSSYPDADKTLRSLREASSTANVTIQRSGNIETGSRGLANWVLYPPAGATGNVTLDIETAGNAKVYLNRIDSDLLPVGAIGHLMLPRELASASITSSDTVGARDTLHINMSAPDTSAGLFLAPNVDVKSMTAPGGLAQFSNFLNTTFSDVSLVVLLNGTGNIIVSASSSPVYVDKADFLVYGSGVLQANFKEIYAKDCVSALVQDHSGTIADGVVLEFTITPHKVCLTSRKYGSQIGVFDDLEPLTPCPSLRMPKTTGRAGDTFQGPTTASPAAAVAQAVQQALWLSVAALIAVLVL